MKAAENKNAGYFALMGTMFRTACRKIPAAFFLMILCTVLAGLLQGASVWYKQRLFDQAEALTGSGTMQALCMAEILLGLCLILQLILKALNGLSEMYFTFEMERAAGSILNQKAARTEAVCFEDNRFLDHVEKAGRGLEAATGIFMVSTEIVLIILSYFGFMGTYLFRIEPGLLFVLGLSFLPYAAGAAVRYQLHRNMENLAAPYRRKGEFYASCITEREYAKETRMLGGYGYFFRKMMENIRMVKQLSWKTAKKSEITDICLRFLSMAGYIGMIVLLFYYLMAGRISVGAFAAIASSLDGMSDTLEQIFNFKLNYITSQLGMAENYLAFLKLPEKKKGVPFPEGKSVEFRNVTFAYPEAAGNSLDHINLSIREGETVAIVGSNGAGKSTLVRLLLGIYQPSEGSVLIDGVDTAKLDPGDSAGHFSAVFQKFQKYKMRVRENVILSDSRDENDIRLKEALDKADLDCQGKSFPDGIDTLLSREFGGTDLSGGQWQRLAIARGLYRRHNLIVLDEPTAAIDPLEETVVYKKFVELSKGKTAVIITHRLGSARIADRIIVLDKGKIAETGRHEELLQKKGIYYAMYQAQAKWYLERG